MKLVGTLSITFSGVLPNGRMEKVEIGILSISWINSELIEMYACEFRYLEKVPSELYNIYANYQTI